MQAFDCVAVPYCLYKEAKVLKADDAHYIP
jgi:hypothetical protein